MMGKLLYLVLQFIYSLFYKFKNKEILIHLSDYVKDHVQSYYGTEPVPSKDEDWAVASYAKNVNNFNIGHKILIL